MRIFAVATIAIIATLQTTQSFSADWRNEELCTAKSVTLAVAKQPNCALAWCARDPSAGELCACLASSGSEKVQMTWRRGAATHRWSADVVPVQMDATSFVLQSFDVQPGPQTPWLFAIRSTQSNGMGVNYWSAHILTQKGVSASLPLQDLGVLSLMTRGGNDDSCRLLAGEWQDGYERSRGSGLYFVAKWQQPAAGEWQVISSLPTVHRRYLFSFEKERLAGLGEKAEPVRWFLHPATRIGTPAQSPEQK